MDIDHISIRPMRAEDVSATSAIFRIIVASLNIYTQEARAGAIAKKTDTSLLNMINEDPYSMLLAWDADRIVGFMASRLDEGTVWMSWVGVLPEYRGHGLGTALVKAVEHTVTQRGIRKVWCDCLTDNRASLALLKKMGYRFVGTLTHHWYGQDYSLWDKYIPERPTEAPDVRVSRVEPKTILHDDINAFIAALADCRAGDGTMIPCDDPRSRRIGFVYHPTDGESIVHEIALRAVKGSTVCVETAARIGLLPHEVYALFSTYDGRHTLVVGHPPEPDSTPEQDDLLQAVMMAAPLRADVQFEGDVVVDVEFPDIELFRSDDLIAPAQQASIGWRDRPDWMPDGWAVLKFPEDSDRASVIEDLSPITATGAFARRGNHLFRAFDDGRWDVSMWHPPIDADDGRYVPGGYRIHLAGCVGKADIESAIAAVLPSYLATAPAIVRGGAP